MYREMKDSDYLNADDAEEMFVIDTSKTDFKFDNRDFDEIMENGFERGLND